MDIGVAVVLVIGLIVFLVLVYFGIVISIRSRPAGGWPKKKGEGLEWIVGAIIIIACLFVAPPAVAAVLFIIAVLAVIALIVKEKKKSDPKKHVALQDRSQPENTMKSANPRPVETKIELAPNKPPVIVNSNVDEEDELFLFDEYEEDI